MCRWNILSQISSLGEIEPMVQAPGSFSFYCIGIRLLQTAFGGPIKLCLTVEAFHM